MEFSAESIKKINGLAMAVLNKPSKDLNKEELEKIMMFDMLSLPDELNVSTGDTRRTEQQYCTNTYGGGMKASLSGLKELVRRNALEHEDPNVVLETYLADKAAFIQFIKFKYASMEATLRDLSREAQIKDKIISIGRYAND